jgi:LysR family transcriptional regulator, glycine cleavage system transcriptional activator
LDEGMAFRLPPLSSLRVFEAAARHHSFRKAADELSLTASAVSHAVQTLENWLGVELFSREARGLRLTSAGEAYAPLVNQALALLASATDKVPGRRPTGTLALSSAPSFATKVLVPRLARFTTQFPDIHLTIDTSTRIVDLALDDFDVAIRYVSIKKPAANWTMLVPETLVPVCAPTVKQRFADATLVELLSRMTLIHVTTVSADWKHWFRATGLELPPSIDDGMHIDTIHTAFEAAVRGLGIVLGRRPLVDEDLESGRLVALADQTVPSDSAFWLVTSQTEFEKPEVKQFRRWLLSELGADAAPQTRSQLVSTSNC